MKLLLFEVSQYCRYETARNKLTGSFKALVAYRPDSDTPESLSRFPSRNVWISTWIFLETGQKRTPKQVGSRLQQLRETNKHCLPRKYSHDLQKIIELTFPPVVQLIMEKNFLPLPEVCNLTEQPSLESTFTWCNEQMASDSYSPRSSHLETMFPQEHYLSYTSPHVQYRHESSIIQQPPTPVLPQAHLPIDTSVVSSSPEIWNDLPNSPPSTLSSSSIPSSPSSAWSPMFGNSQYDFWNGLPDSLSSTLSSSSTPSPLSAWSPLESPQYGLPMDFPSASPNYYDNYNVFPQATPLSMFYRDPQSFETSVDFVDQWSSFGLTNVY